ncbi:DNA gyrase inhibitor YacG [Legionella massiliensis]|uniref:DNA gyrase inhibitor YacG n=1 Tax=Legionella massiliensis TaxID=1034943 RepID=UPI0005C38C7F|nr:DNA gyrase inhibitor YacG [Legionella massiliensis]
MKNLEKITCPTCGKQNTWRPENAFRPFCSERCRLIDLGEWASENRKIAADPDESEGVAGPEESDD